MNPRQPEREKMIAAAKNEFSKYLNTGKQLTDIEGVEACWFDYCCDDIINVVYFFKGVGFDITLKVINSHELEMTEIVVAK